MMRSNPARSLNRARRSSVSRALPTSALSVDLLGAVSSAWATPHLDETATANRSGISARRVPRVVVEKDEEILDSQQNLGALACAKCSLT